MPDSVITRHLTKRKSADGKDGMALSLGLPRSQRSNGEQQQEIREARRMLKECVRCDWEYPALPRFRRDEPAERPREVDEGEQEADEDDGSEGEGEGIALVEQESIAGFRFYNPSNHDRKQEATAENEADTLDFEPVEWREREYPSSDYSSDDANDRIVATDSNGSTQSTYKFEGPDSVGTQLADRKLAWKRQRQKRLEEEMAWNDGLAHWVARRDVWCHAHTSAQIQLRESRKQSEYSAAESSIASSPSTPRTSTSGSSSSSSAAAEDEDSRDTESRQTSTSTAVTTPDLVPSKSILPMRSQTSIPPPPPASSSTDILVPLAPPMLPNHPIRRRITPETYPEIYSKIILQSRSPSVPINLQVMVRALVQGWKDDGEWPPKNAPPEKSIARKKGAEGALKSGVKAVGRVLRITGSAGGESGSGGKEKEKG